MTTSYIDSYSSSLASIFWPDGLCSFICNHCPSHTLYNLLIFKLLAVFCSHQIISHSYICMFLCFLFFPSNDLISFFFCVIPAHLSRFNSGVICSAKFSLTCQKVSLLVFSQHTSVGHLLCVGIVCWLLSHFTLIRSNPGAMSYNVLIFLFLIF